MSIVVFVGPSVKRAEAAAILDATYLPPAAQGDVYRAARERPSAIGIIDGYFSGAPSVWHKEILWALSQGVAVFGSASMGALRAAELHPFGMQGAGRIFEAFRDGVLEDDDEVAVVHGPLEAGYIVASEPMVNIRATLARAVDESVIAAPLRDAIEKVAKALHFPKREWPSILDGVRGAAEAELLALRRWLPQGRVDQKRADALEMLALMRDRPAAPSAAIPTFAFARTFFFDELVARSGERLEQDQPGATAAPRAVIEELRLAGAAAYERTKARALLRHLAVNEARGRGASVSSQELGAAMGRWRAAQGLFRRAELDAWLAGSDLDAATLEHLIGDEVLAGEVTRASGPRLERELLDELRLAGRYRGLADRARSKRDTVEGSGRRADRPAPPPPSVLELRHWYFERRLGQPMPDDIALYASELGFRNLADFDSALQREWLYLYMVDKA